MNGKLDPRIQDYLDLVASGTQEMCKYQIQLARLIKNAFATEDIYVDSAQLDRYMGLQKHFPYRLLPWEKFVFALHNCTYTKTGALRWPILFVLVGRGAGKNGYLAFEDFALVTPINGVKKYNIDIFATSEDQAKATFDDIYDILEGDEAYFKKFFYWTKEVIENLKTKSRIKYHTKAPNTKDGGRPGKVDFDEVHAYENKDLINVAVTGLGKRKHPRRSFITTQGDVRGGPLDEYFGRGKKVLEGEIPDGGWLYFICTLDSDEEIMDPKMWGKANPSLYDPTRTELLDEIKLEFLEYKEDPAANTAFATKRMNRPQGKPETEVTSWENLKAASRPLPDDLDQGYRPCVWAIDYASTQDFVAAGILLEKDEIYYWITHSWVCAQSKTLSRIKFPLEEAETRGELTMVDEVEILPDVPITWVVEQAAKYNLLLGAIDHYRFTLLSKAAAAAGFDPDRKTGNIHLTYTTEVSQVAPIIASVFNQHRIVWGDSKLMRWYTNNTKRVVDGKGNITFEKIEPKTRKTDGFMALVMAFIAATIKQDELESGGQDIDLPDVYEF